MSNSTTFCMNFVQHRHWMTQHICLSTKYAGRVIVKPVLDNL